MDLEEHNTSIGSSGWEPKTKIGKMVKSGEIKNIEEIFNAGKTIKEVEIVDMLLPTIEDKVLEICSVQRMTKNNRKQKFRVTVVVGDKNGHLGLGAAKDVEVRPAIDTSIREAKKNMIAVKLGCGSWECGCGTAHSLPVTQTAKCGSAMIILKPAPKGVGIVASKTVKTVLELAGIKDVWTFSNGRTRDVYNMATATFMALQGLAELRNNSELKAMDVENK